MDGSSHRSRLLKTDGSSVGSHNSGFYQQAELKSYQLKMLTNTSVRRDMRTVYGVKCMHRRGPDWGLRRCTQVSKTAYIWWETDSCKTSLFNFQPGSVHCFSILTILFQLLASLKTLLLWLWLCESMVCVTYDLCWGGGVSTANGGWNGLQTRAIHDLYPQL